jgi:hypothetical protein
MVGGMRVGMHGDPASFVDDEAKAELALKEVNFYQSFYSPFATVQKSFQIGFSLIQIVNKTEAKTGAMSDEFEGQFVPYFAQTFDSTQIFDTAQAYMLNTAAASVWTFEIGDFPYFIFNEQKPVARTAEAAFHLLLFVTVLLDVFHVVFLIFVLCKPLVICARRKMKGQEAFNLDEVSDSSEEEEEERERHEMGKHAGRAAAMHRLDAENEREARGEMAPKHHTAHSASLGAHGDHAPVELHPLASPPGHHHEQHAQ